jgi:hypothetical protein
MTIRRRPSLAVGALALFFGLTLVPPPLTAAGELQSPEQFIGFPLGADRKLVRWDTIVEYLRLADHESDRVHMRELGLTNHGNPFVLLEISSPDTLKDLDRYRKLERKLYFQDGAPTQSELQEIFDSGKAVVLVTCSVHGNEIGATQMVLELVHTLATDNSSAVRRILDNVIFLLVPSANPDGQILATDWFNRNVGTPYESSQLPTLYHPYAGHDSNRDMYMFTQKESQYMADLVWSDWFPAIWLDEHQMGGAGPRMFVMPAADPINPNVHPLTYRWNAILGQSQAASLEAAGKTGIIYNSTYTNFWQGALAWSGWWHNQIGLLTEVASAQVAAPVEQARVNPAGVPSVGRGSVVTGGAPLPPPTDVRSRTEYPRPWLGGRWTLRDIVDYELIATMALLETAADRREAILRQIYEVNRQTVEERRAGDPAAIIIPIEGQQDIREAGHLVDRLNMGGVEVSRAGSAFQVDGRRYAPGTFVIPMTQVFSRYAIDLLEQQTYPQVTRRPNGPPEPPYDVTAWSLGMLLGVDVDFAETAPPASAQLTRVARDAIQRSPGYVTGDGRRFSFEYLGPDTAIVLNRLLKADARVQFSAPSRVVVLGIEPEEMESLAKEFGLAVTAVGDNVPSEGRPGIVLKKPRIALYAPWTGGNIDEGWTRWVLEQYGFDPTTVHNEEMRRGGLRQRFDVLIFADQSAREIVDGQSGPQIRPEYRGGIGDEGVESIAGFIADGGTLVTLGAASNLAIDHLPIPVRNLKRGLQREEHFAPGTIVQIQTDTSQPFGYGMSPSTFGFYTNGPLFAPIDGFSNKTSVVARYPGENVLASGWLMGEGLMAGRAAAVSVDMNPGRVVLFGFRPQHRGQTHSTFPLLFNAIYMGAAEKDTFRSTDQQQ